MARMRTINKAIDELKREDPGTCVSSYHVLRRMVDRGDIPHIKQGRTIWVDLDKIEARLSGEAVNGRGLG